MIEVEHLVIAKRIELKRFAAAVREMLDAQDLANQPDSIPHERQIARGHEQNVRQWIRTITAETLAEDTLKGRTAA